MSTLYDQKILENILKYKNSVLKNHKKTEKILNISEILLKNYSFSDFQTYPRPNHPDINKRKNVYFTMIAILLSLRTTLENEQKATKSFLNKYRTPQDVLNSSFEQLCLTIQAAGMPQKKATSIIKATKYVVENLNASFEYLKDLPITKAREELMKIPGIGQKSADCILELGLDLPTIVIDINMLRVVSRIFNTPFALAPDLSNKEQLKIAKELIENNLPKDALLYQTIHTMFLVHGKKTCKASPQCHKCIVKSFCEFSYHQIKQMQLFSKQ